MSDFKIPYNLFLSDDPAGDVDCDGINQVEDINRVVQWFLFPPGPSGLSCAGIDPGAPTDCRD